MLIIPIGYSGQHVTIITDAPLCVSPLYIVIIIVNHDECFGAESPNPPPQPSTAAAEEEEEEEVTPELSSELNS